jgi:hypothetical protein
METFAIILAVEILLVGAAYTLGRRSGEGKGREEGFRRGYEYAKREKPQDTVNIPFDPSDLR